MIEWVAPAAWIGTLARMALVYAVAGRAVAQASLLGGLKNRGIQAGMLEPLSPATTLKLVPLEQSPIGDNLAN